MLVEALESEPSALLIRTHRVRTLAPLSRNRHHSEPWAPPLIRLDEPGRRVDVGERHRQRFLFIARDQTKALEVLWTKSKRPRIETSRIALRGLLLPAGKQNVAPGSSLSGRPTRVLSRLPGCADYCLIHSN
jgi:hypothetical protein